jgi:Ca2+-binding RTX toxin-like protein
MADITGSKLKNILRGTDEIDFLYGTNGDDILIALAGNDLLDGGQGADSMRGGPGNDVYYVDNLNDKIIEIAGEGIDSVFSMVDGYRLPGQVENLTILDLDGLLGTTAYGNSLNNVIKAQNGEGYSYDDTFFGGGGNDTLLGGSGNDRLYGQTGNDILDGTTDAGSRIRGLSDGFDLLIGGDGADTYVLGDGNNYLGEEFVEIVGFSWRQGDKLQVADPTLYRVERSSSSLSGNAAKETLIYQGDDLIAMLVDRPNFDISRDFITAVSTV